PRLRGRETLHFSREVTLTPRGRHAAPPPRVVSGHPFGLTERVLTLGAGGDLLVLPALGQVHRGRLRRYLMPAGHVGARARARAIRSPAAHDEFHGLRAFRSGDSPRWIHWRTTARRGELMVREFEETP